MNFLPTEIQNIIYDYVLQLKITHFQNDILLQAIHFKNVRICNLINLDREYFDKLIRQHYTEICDMFDIQELYFDKLYFDKLYKK